MPALDAADHLLMTTHAESALSDPADDLDDQSLDDVAGFGDLGVSEPIVEALSKKGIVEPFPVQTLTIPDALAGRDVCGKAKTGSGKTLAFGLPMIMRTEKAAPRRPRAMVLVPTRELCAQVSSELRPLAKASGLSIAEVYGGVSMSAQINKFTRGVDIVVATPGRLIDLIERKEVFVDDVSMVVLDEADQMADMGFLPQVEHILRAIEGDHQSLLFSATLDGVVERIVNKYLTDPVYHEVESDTVTVESMDHRFIEVHHMDKPKVVGAIAETAERLLVFVHTKRGCDRAAEQMAREGLSAQAIHGDLPQIKRERVLKQFGEGEVKILVATNVAARGLHVEGVDVVIHYDPPSDHKTYLHRSGRTARAGEDGLVVTFVELNQIPQVRALMKEAGVFQPIIKMFSNDARLRDLQSYEPPPEAPPVKRSRRRRRL